LLPLPEIRTVIFVGGGAWAGGRWSAMFPSLASSMANWKRFLPKKFQI
jgi:hypothetical protein